MFDFPTSPTEGQTFTPSGGPTYIYNAPRWVVKGGGASITVGTTPPASPIAGALWWNSDAATGGGQMYIYYDDGTGALQWVPSAAAASLTSPGGDFTASNPSSFTPSTSGAAVGGVLTTILSGNTGNYFNPATGRWTPPAGRYFIWALGRFSTGSAAAQGYVYIYKNGVQLGVNGGGMTTAGAGYVGFGSSQATVDANGTDYFEMWAYGQSGGGNTISANGAVFGAFPISGVKGPPGDPYPGTVGGDFFAINTTGAGITTSFGTVIFPTVVTGNSGGNYNPVTGAYQPPAGRYRLSASGDWSSSSGGAAVQIRFRKNGVAIASPGAIGGSGAANFYAFAMADALVDANGSDVFDVQMACGGGGITSVGTLWVLAYPVSGVKGPPGDPGPAGSVPTGDVQAGSGVFTPSLGVDVVIVFPTIIVGNSGSWLNVSNGRYTPPAGRYFIQCTHGVQAPSGGNGTWTLKARKNGVVIGGAAPQLSGSLSFSLPITLGMEVDANGTDYFEFVANIGSAGMNNQGGSFTAYPISGVKGPAGDIGAPVAAFNVRATTADTLSGAGNMALFRGPGLSTPVKDHDPDNVWDLNNARFTAPSTGRYTFSVAAYMIPSAAAIVALVIRHTTSADVLIRNYITLKNADQNNYGVDFELTQEFQMSAGDRVQFVVSNNTAVSTNINGNGGTANMSGSLTFASGRKVV